MVAVRMMITVTMGGEGEGDDMREEEESALGDAAGSFGSVKKSERASNCVPGSGFRVQILCE